MRRRAETLRPLSGPVAALVIALGLSAMAACASLRGRGLGLVSAVRAPTPTPPPLSLPLTGPDGLDESDLPTRHPEASWLPITGDERESNALVPVEVNGRPTVAMLDTGATSSMVGEEVARRLGVIDEARFRGTVEVVAHGRTLTADRYVVEIRLGDYVLSDAEINVFAGSNFMPVVGFSVLKQLDVYLALDAGLVGLFPAGRGPTFGGALSFDLVEHADGIPYLDAWVLTPERDRYQQAVPLAVDTGATTTDVPAGVLGGHAVVRRGTAETIDGRHLESAEYDVGDLVIGRRQLQVGPAIVRVSTDTYGHLGLDVVRRFHALFSARRRAVFVEPRPRRPSHRLLGPNGVACGGQAGPAPCIEVELIEDERSTQACAKLRADYGKEPLALELSAEDGAGRIAWGAGAATLYVRRPRAGTEVCEPLKIRPSQEPAWRVRRVALDRVYRPTSYPCGRRTSCLSRRAPLP